MLTHKIFIVIIAVSAILYNFSGSVIYDIEFCDMYDKCVNPKGEHLNTSVPPGINIPNSTNIDERQRKCKEEVFCNCTNNKKTCGMMDVYELESIKIISLIAYCVAIALFMCHVFTSRKSLFIEEMEMKYFLRKLIVVIIIFIFYFIFNLLAACLMLAFVFNKHDVTVGKFTLNLPWLVFTLVFAGYIVFGTTHNAQILRYYRIKRLTQQLIKVRNPPEEDDCPICLDNLSKRTCLKVSCCNNHFHRVCLIPVIILSNMCPLCRHKPIVDENIAETVDPTEVPLLSEV